MLQAFDFVEPSHSECPSPSLQAALTPHEPPHTPRAPLYQGELDSLASPALLEDSPQQPFHGAPQEHAVEAASQSLCSQDAALAGPMSASQAVLPGPQQQLDPIMSLDLAEHSMATASSSADLPILPETEAAAQPGPAASVQSGAAVLTATGSRQQQHCVTYQQQLEDASALSCDENLSSDGISSSGQSDHLSDQQLSLDDVSDSEAFLTFPSQPPLAPQSDAAMASKPGAPLHLMSDSKLDPFSAPQSDLLTRSQADTHLETHPKQAMDPQSSSSLQLHAGMSVNPLSPFTLDTGSDPFLAYLQTNEQLSPMSSHSADESLHAEDESDTHAAQQQQMQMSHGSGDHVYDASAAEALQQCSQLDKQGAASMDAAHITPSSQQTSQQQQQQQQQQTELVCADSRKLAEDNVAVMIGQPSQQPSLDGQHVLHSFSSSSYSPIRSTQHDAALSVNPSSAPETVSLQAVASVAEAPSHTLQPSSAALPQSDDLVAHTATDSWQQSRAALTEADALAGTGTAGDSRPQPSSQESSMPQHSGPAGAWGGFATAPSLARIVIHKPTASSSRAEGPASAEHVQVPSLALVSTSALAATAGTANSNE